MCLCSVHRHVMPHINNVMMQNYFNSLVLYLWTTGMYRVRLSLSVFLFSSQAIDEIITVNFLNRYHKQA